MGSPNYKRPKGAIRRYRDIEAVVKKAQAGEHITLFKVKNRRSAFVLQKHHLSEKAVLNINEIRDKGFTMLDLYNLDQPTIRSERIKNFLFTNYFFAFAYLQRLLQTQHD